jgi:hypothetical protein
MAYKKIEHYFSFADIAVNSNADKNRSLLFLRQLDKSIDWERHLNNSNLYMALNNFQHK